MKTLVNKYKHELRGNSHNVTHDYKGFNTNADKSGMDANKTKNNAQQTKKTQITQLIQIIASKVCMHNIFFLPFKIKQD